VTFLVWRLRIGACGVGACGFGAYDSYPIYPDGISNSQTNVSKLCSTRRKITNAKYKKKWPKQL